MDVGAEYQDDTADVKELSRQMQMFRQMKN
jgi:hypothetical protein